MIRAEAPGPRICPSFLFHGVCEADVVEIGDSEARERSGSGPAAARRLPIAPSLRGRGRDEDSVGDGAFSISRSDGESVPLLLTRLATGDRVSILASLGEEPIVPNF